MSRFRQHCERQAEACTALGSPFTAQLCRLLGSRLTANTVVAEKLLNWENLAADAVALRVAGGLHALAMASPNSALAVVYPPNLTDDEALWRAVSDALADNTAFWLDWLDSAPQTNEVRRCSGLIPAFHWLAARHNMPLRLSEIGASAGLNTNWDRYALNIGEQVWGPMDSLVQLKPDWRGPLPPNTNVVINNKEGCDLHPIDPSDPESRKRLHAYIWPDQPERHQMTSDALDMASGLVRKEDALTFLNRRLLEPSKEELHIIFHSIVWQYLPANHQEACKAAIIAVAKDASAQKPLAWVSIEADETRGSAAMTCTSWPGRETTQLGRIDFHGRWVDWKPEMASS